ncbi:MAG TPA: DUF4349 domain-containing protein [Cyclobacteriaceae bacterium]|jgi:hypothetical protein|nr:DUF4349 domain-containing protein [Cytophagales bacterium]HMR56612.1 DUF4349 domain-containing protein [Cyclobacteriaceae bacterium]HNT50177.1 DUF4349 domain-containing protein [Cyclobacteriaceae bacterium]HRE67901.1 DUF4349 domain-containing protein [Cyclobacteriaceae bacterium]HRF32063.1 DUF4349 domain-containing protein [Cyclobacteriaceae bacterium]
MKIYIFLIGTLFLASCRNSNSDMPQYEVANADGFLQKASLPPPTEQPAQEIVERKLIRNGNIEFLTKDVRKTKTEIERITKEQKGYISSENENNYGNRFQVNQTLRIPADKFDEVMKQLEGLAEKVDNKNINAQDVTEEFIDVEARLKTKKELEARYLELLKQAKTVADIVSIEGQIANVRAEIESMEGRLKYLSNQVSFSTLNVSFYQESAAGYGFGSKFLNSLKSGWFNLIDFVFWVLSVWPFVLGITALVIWWVRRRSTV